MTATDNIVPAVPEAVEAAPARPSLLSALKVRDFRLVWAGESISILGDQFYMVALPWLTLNLTGSALALGTVGAVAAIPRALFMIVGGAMTDRFAPRNVMLVSNSLRIFLTALLTLLVLTNSVQLWMLYILAFAFGTVDAFFFPAQSAIVPQLVSKEQIESGNAISQITAQLAGFIGPALAGLIIATLSGAASVEALEQSGKGVDGSALGVAFAFDTLTFIVAAVALWLIRGGRSAIQKDGEQQDLLSSIREGWQVVWNDPVLRVMLFITAAINFLFGGPMGVGIQALAKFRFVEGAFALGVIMSAFGGGALVGAILGGSLPAPKRLGIVAVTLVGVGGAAMGLFGYLYTLLPAVLVAVFMGVTIGYVNVVMFSWMQKRTPAEVMGRVMSITMLGSVGLQPIASALAGVIADFNLTLLFVLPAVLMVVVTILSLMSRPMRELRSA
jgi:MFS family permease